VQKHDTGCSRTTRAQLLYSSRRLAVCKYSKHHPFLVRKIGDNGASHTKKKVTSGKWIFTQQFFGGRTAH